ncbi:MAG: protease modulator HflC [Spirochaetes bacterium]|nr:protease modulator HflC [Spirochaetota bacterium]
MINKKLAIILITVLVIIVLLIAMGPFWILREGQQAVVVRFGRIVDVQQQAGLKLKIPFIDNVVRYSSKILSWDGRAQDRIPTSEQLFILVDVTARWRISDPKQFYSAVVSMHEANNRLNEIIFSAVRTVISNNTLREAVRNSNLINEDPVPQFEIIDGEEEVIQALEELITRSVERQVRIERGRDVLANEMFDAVSVITPQFGITLIDIIIRQIRYSDELKESVYNRMIVDRNQEAQIYRSAGEGQKARWLGQLEQDKRTILSEAYNTAQVIKGQADAEATRIFINAHARDPEFFEFWRSLESYRVTFPHFNKILSTDIEYFRYFNRQRPTR